MKSPSRPLEHPAGGDPSYPLGVAGRAAIRRPDGRVLLVRRSEHETSDPSTWELPGGKMGYREQLIETVIREVREETGLHVRPGRVIDVGHRRVDPYWVTVVTYLCDNPGQPITLGDEHDAYEWVPIRIAGERPTTPEAVDALRALSVACVSGDVVE